MRGTLILAKTKDFLEGTSFRNPNSPHARLFSTVSKAVR
jgi:hypothetical protein